MIKIDTIPLGYTGEPVSQLCLGTMYFGSRIDEEMSFWLLDQYVDYGGTFLDTANFFARWLPMCVGGESEMTIGRWLRRRARRGRMFIASKVGFEYPGVDRGLRAKHIEYECDRSLKRLDTDHIDLYYANLDDRDSPLEESLRAFDKLVQAGKVRYIGASNFMSWRMEEARWISVKNHLPGYCCIQQRHTYLQPRSESHFGPMLSANNELIDYVKNRNITLIAYSTLLRGAYTRPDRALPEQYVSADNEKRRGVLKSMAHEVDATVNQVILAWMMQSEPPIIPIIAARSSDQLDENMRSLKVKLSQDQIYRLNNAVFFSRVPNY